MKIAVIGAGLSGLATAWHIRHHHPSAKVTLFDEKGLGTGASKIAGGLLHAYSGAHAKQAWQSDAALEEAKALLDVASHVLNKPVYKKCGILRVAVTDEQKEDFRHTAKAYNDVEWWSPHQCQEAFSELLPHPGIFITSGISVDCPLYLEGLLQACREQEVEFVIRHVDSLQELPGYDMAIFASGKGLINKPLLNVRLTKGQLLVLRYNKPLPFPIISEKYLTFGRDPGTVVAGATYERKWATEDIEPHIAQADILAGIAAFAPIIATSPILECRSAFRAWVPSHKPFVTQIGQKEWAIGGLGSKGLLYHAWLGKRCAEAISQ